MQKCRLIFILLATVLLTSCSSHQKYTNLGNPTSYTFHRDYKAVTSKIDYLKGINIDDYLSIGNRDGKYYIYIAEHSSTYYWDGPDEIGDPPESGTLGQITGFFDIVIQDKGTETNVEVKKRELKQIVGRHYSFPEMNKVPTWKNIKSNSFFEYLFLHRLGQELGEDGMPPLKK